LVPSLIAACAVSLVLSAACLCWIVLFSNPASFRRELERFTNRVKDSEGACSEMAAAWLKYRTEMASLEESVEGMLDSVERKRRQISGAASRLQPVVPDNVPVTRDEIVTEARKRVYGGAA